MVKNKDLRIFLGNLQNEFKDAFIKRNFALMNEVYPEIIRVKNLIKHIEYETGTYSENIKGNDEYYDNKEFFCELSDGNNIALPLKLVNLLKIDSDTLLVMSLLENRYYISLRREDFLPLEMTKLLPDILLAEITGINKKRELFLPDSFKTNIGISIFDILIIHGTDEEIEIRRFNLEEVL